MAKIIFLVVLFSSFFARAEKIHCTAVEDRQLPLPAEFKITEWNWTPDSDGDVSELTLSPLFPGYSFQVDYSRDLEILSVKIHYAVAPTYRTLVNSLDTSKNTGLARLTLTETIAASMQNVQQRISMDFACGVDATKPLPK